MKKLILALLGLGFTCATLFAGNYVVSTTTDFPVSGVNINVNTNNGQITGGAGDGKVSLRSAVIAANANSNSLITLPAGTYTLTIAGDDGSTDPDPTVGDLDILTSVTIVGSGAAVTVIQAGTTSTNGIDQIFNFNAYYQSLGQSAVTNGFSASLSGVTLRNGMCASSDASGNSYLGGALSFDGGYNGGSLIAHPGTLTISNCVFDSCSTLDGPGGAIGILDGGMVSINNCVFTNNVANAVSGVSYGGAIYVANTVNSSSITISNSTFLNNHSFGAGGAMATLGAIGSTNSPTFIVHNCVIANNIAEADGGGILSQDSSLTVDQGSIISNNISEGSVVASIPETAAGGGFSLLGTPGFDTLVISNCTILGNIVSTNASSQLGGGGISVQDGSATVVDCRIVGNQASTGSGLFKNNANGTVTAVNNWWGSNGGPGAPGSDTVVALAPGIATFNPFLTLSFTVSPVNIFAGSSPAVLTASITNSSFAAPNGTPVVFNVNFGSLTISNTQLTSGTATSSLSSSTAGNGTAIAIVDKQTNSVAFAFFTTATAPTITSATNTTFSVASNGSFTVTETGYPNPGVTESGTLPTNVTFNAATGVLSGTPAAGTGGQYPIVFTATNGVAPNNAQNFTLTVNQPAAVNCPSDIQASFASPVSFAASATGFPAPVITYQLGTNTITSPYTFPQGTNLVTTTAANAFSTNTCSFNVIVSGPIAAPQLSIVASGTNVVVSWPLGASAYQLQTSPTLGTNWSNYTGVIGSNSSTFFTTNGATSGNLFYRLVH